MDQAKAQQLLTSGLDTAVSDVRGSFSKVVVTFKATSSIVATALYVFPDGSYTVSRAATPTDQTFLELADAYTRAATFVRQAGLTAEGPKS